MEEYLQKIEFQIDYLLKQFDKKGKFDNLCTLDALEIINRNVQKIREASK